MRKGESAEGLEFYELLFADDNFCRELGRTVLASGKLESPIARYLNIHAPEKDTVRATLGKLIGFLEDCGFLKEMLSALKNVKIQRDYLTHNIHALFSGLINVTKLERSGLLDSDIDLFSDRARQLNEDLNKLADIISKAP